MAIASFPRYSYIKVALKEKENLFDLLFFTPCEELGGANMLQRLSTDYETIIPFLDKIESEFIVLMNHCCKNMKKYLNQDYSLSEI